MYTIAHQVEPTMNKALLKDIHPRIYQETILATCALKNTLVVLPTGLGKTMIALLLSINRIENHKHSKIMFLAPTKPLADQHFQTFKQHLTCDDSLCVLFTGSVSPEKRAQQFEHAQFIFSTPQGLENDLITNKISLADVSLIVFDEAHRATGNYAYTFIAEHYMKYAQHPRILGLTASPGSDAESINEVLNNLHIEDLEVRSEVDPDVAPYVQDVTIRFETVHLPPSFQKIHSYLLESYRSKLRSLKELDIIKSSQEMSRTELLKLQAHLRADMGGAGPEVFKALSLCAECMKVQHAIELVETQGITPLSFYLEELYKDAATSQTKAVRNLASDPNIKSARILTDELKQSKEEHPKIAKVLGTIQHYLKENSSTKIILFNQFRDTASHLVSRLREEGITCELFIGQASKRDKGLSQKEQRAVLDQFRQGAFTVLVATSVAEEGLDIPKVDHVLFYEPIPSTIRTIQRRGRTGRGEEGAVTVFMTKGTRDEIYRWSAHHKERRMYAELKDIKKQFRLGKIFASMEPQKTLNDIRDPTQISSSAITIFADHREKGSTVIKQLLLLGATCSVDQLRVGDFVLSKRVAVEYKSVKDFIDSLLDGRMFSQLKNLKVHYERPLLIVEGTDSMYAQRNVHPNAIKGMIASILIDFGITLFQTKDNKETAELLYIIAKREQEESISTPQIHTAKTQESLKEMQEYIVSALPNVGIQLAKQLLKEFGSVENIVNASPEDLQKIPQIGEKKAKEIQRVLKEKY